MTTHRSSRCSCFVVRDVSPLHRHVRLTHGKQKTAILRSMATAKTSSDNLYVAVSKRIWRTEAATEACTSQSANLIQLYVKVLAYFTWHLPIHIDRYQYTESMTYVITNGNTVWFLTGSQNLGRKLARRIRIVTATVLSQKITRDLRLIVWAGSIENKIICNASRILLLYIAWAHI